MLEEAAVTDQAGHPESAGGPEGPRAGGEVVRYEETLSMDDPAGAGGLRSTTYLLVGGMVAVTLVGLVVFGLPLVSQFVSKIGGVDGLTRIASRTVADRPLVAVAALGILLLPAAWLLVSVVGMVRGLQRAFDTRIEIRVTDREVAISRDGSRRGQSAGVRIPMETITAVEYNDPELSSTRLEIGDLRAPTFLAGRSTTWIRLERQNEPAVYVGSDRPRELAETIATSAPAVASAAVF